MEYIESSEDKLHRAGGQFDASSANPSWPTFGYKLVEPREGSPHTIRGPISMFAALFATMMEAHDARCIEGADFTRTIPIPILGVRTTEFDVSRERKEALYESGRSAAEDFLERWDFEVYNERYRRKEPAGRSTRV